MFSKTWLLGLALGAVPQVVAFIEGQTPTLVLLLQGVAPGYLDPLIAGVVPVVSAWGTAILLTMARNDGVKSGTIANPAIGTKKLWKS